MESKIGYKFLTNEGYEIKIIEQIDKINYMVEFSYKKDIRKITTFQNIKKGQVKNPYHTSVFNVGYFGEGSYKESVNGKSTKEYNKWHSMLYRCYNEKYLKRQPTYIGCSVDERWLNFQNFAQWMNKNYNPETMDGWHLDKDILVKGNKIYSPETCCFVPQEINTLFTKIEVKNIITYIKRNNKYVVRISKFGKRHHIGTFSTKNEAEDIYNKEKIKYVMDVMSKWEGLISNEIYKK